MDDLGAGRSARPDRASHPNAEREWAYDSASHIGTLARGLDEAPARKWIVIDMKQEWKVIYPSG